MDERGFFSETYHAARLREHGIASEFVQDNHSLSVPAGTLRGLHCQASPHAQDKLVRVTRGSILDIAVDIRHGSATFGRHVTAVLSAENWQQMFVPAGVLHGFVTLEENTEVTYKVTDYYTPTHEYGVRWDDPDLAIDWRLGSRTPLLSRRDAGLPYLRNLHALF